MSIMWWLSLGGESGKLGSPGPRPKARARLLLGGDLAVHALQVDVRIGVDLDQLLDVQRLLHCLLGLGLGRAGVGRVLAVQGLVAGVAGQGTYPGEVDAE